MSRSDLPLGARFDPVTGAELRAGSGAGERRQSFALQPGEPVASFNLVTSLMPLAGGTTPQTYRWALAMGVLVPVLAGALGYLAFAFVAAALVVPVVYLVYLYDVNQWEDEPLPVVVGAVALASALGVGFTFAWHAGLLGGDLAPVAVGDHGAGGVRWSSLLVTVLLVPLVGEALKQVGPLVLAARPAFDDLIDGLTFGVVSGASFAAAETLVVNRALFSSFGSIDHPDAGFWVSLILSAAIVKPVVYGAATGIAVAGFSGLGAGYAGFRPAYLRGLGEALLANVLFQAGLFFAARIGGTSGAVVGLVWGALVAAALLVRVRYVLHFAVLEAALDALATGTQAKDTARGTAYCPSCEMPLVSGAGFCVVCGTSVRAGSKVTRARNRVDDTVPGASAATRPTLRVTPPGQAPRDTRATGLVLGAVAATLLVGGGIGQAAAAAAAQPGSPPPPPVSLQPQVGQGPTTPPAPTPAPAPGPTPDASVTPTAGTRDGSLPGLGIDSPTPSTSPAPVAPAQAATTTTPRSAAADLGGGLGFELPDGWTVGGQEPGFAEAESDGGIFIAEVLPAPTDVQTMVAAQVGQLQGIGLQDLQVTDPQDVGVPTSDVVQCVQLGYQGVLATQQGGTLPVEGFVFHFLLQDGRGVTAFALYPQGAISSPDDPLVADYNLMLTSLVSTL